MNAGRRRALFLDRDGTLVRDVGYPRDPAAMELVSGVVPVLLLAQNLGYRLVVVSNQSGVARGIIQPEEAKAVQAKVEALFGAEGISFAAVKFCFHGPNDACACRKPAPGMLTEAAAELDLDLSRSIMVGDKPSDIEAGVAAGCSFSIGIGAGASHPGATCWVEGWSEVEEWLYRDADEGRQKG